MTWFADIFMKNLWENWEHNWKQLNKIISCFLKFSSVRSNKVLLWISIPTFVRLCIQIKARVYNHLDNMSISNDTISMPLQRDESHTLPRGRAQLLGVWHSPDTHQTGPASLPEQVDLATATSHPEKKFAITSNISLDNSIGQNWNGVILENKQRPCFCNGWVNPSLNYCWFSKI